MTYDQIHNLFKQRYNQANWKQFLGEAFIKSRLLATPETLTGIDSNVASKVQKLGYITLNENGIERQIAIFEVTLAQGIILERNRVGLRNLLRKYWKDIDAAFIAYHRPETPNWRFTYVSELTGYDADGEFIKIKTEPKRYTYVLGEGESTRTAAERFAVIANKGSKATLDDVKEAFSVEKLSKAFFDEYKKHYDIFCDYMVSKPNIRQTIFNGDEKAIRDFNKKLLGRIVFLYFIQKKGWLGVPVADDWGKGNFNFLSQQFESFRNKNGFYQEFLSPLFFETLNQKRENDIAPILKNQGNDKFKIPYLNGGLFEEDDKKHRNLIFDTNLFKNLFEFFNQYNFTIYEDDPNDHTVAVDPEMLGHIFENLLEDNKDKGAYYTPKEIVHYMCQESLIEYLCTTLKIADEIAEKEAITNFLKKKEIDKILKSKIKELNDALDNVKICDPAIGSGAFPMGLLHEIFTAKQTLHTFEKGNTKNFNASEVKLNIIQNSIYGVDIEKGAVDIARLRFWLSLIVDEEKPKALPNLDYKIVVGNSLVSKFEDEIIDINWEIKYSVGKAAEYIKKLKNALTELTKKQKEYFIAENKESLKVEIRALKIEILFNQLAFNREQYANSNVIKTDMGFGLKPAEIKKNLEIQLQLKAFDQSLKKLERLKQKTELPLHFFDWKLDFPEVMNPLLKENGNISSTTGFDIVIGNPPYVQSKFLDNEIKSVYIEKYISSKKQFDIFNFFIEINKFLLQPNAICNYIIPDRFIVNSDYIDLRQFIINHYKIKEIITLGDGVFEDVNMPTAILSFFAGKSEDYEFNVKKHLKDFGAKIKSKNILSDKQLKFPVFISDESISIIEKIDKKGKKISDFFDDIRGVEIGKDSDLIISKEQKNTVPFLRGKDISKYFLKSETFLKLSDLSIRYKDQFWYEGPKILFRKTGTGINATLDYSNNYVIQVIFIIKLKAKYVGKLNYNYVLGLINSKLTEYWYFKVYGQEDRTTFPHVTQGKIKDLPLLYLPTEKQNLIGEKVDKIISLKSKGKETNTLEQEIDKLVYQLYDLTDEEIAIIENN